jgi:4-hydroxy-3-polyprenylbenzoate decarboxylase
MTEICDRTLRAEGPALFEQVDRKHIRAGESFRHAPSGGPGHGRAGHQRIAPIGHLLARLKEPEPPKGIKDVMGLGTLVKSLWDMAPKERSSAPCQDVVWRAAMSTWRACRSSTAGRATWRR